MPAPPLADRTGGRRRALAAGLLAASLTVGLLAVLGGSGPEPPEDQAGALAGLLEARLREKAAALGARVATLAELPRLAAAVATDEATVRDLTHEELALQPRPGETITIGQRFGDGRTAVLLALPAGTPAEVLPAPGVDTLVRGQGLLLRHTAVVVPRERTDLVGVLVAGWPVPLSELLPPAVAGARLQVNGRTLGAQASPGPTSAAPVLLPDGRIAQLLLPRPARGFPGPALPLALLAVALAAAALVLFRRPVPASAPALAPVPAPAPWPPSQGVRIGRYQILRPLGSGGMAEVMLARAEGEAGFGKLVAVKVLRPPLSQHPAVVTLFLDEARLAASLDHPNIVQIHDLGRAGDQYYIAMEYIDGADLAHLIEALRTRTEMVPLPVAIAILRRICDGLHAAHTATGPDGQPLQLVHRDVKSANVFISRAGAVKIGDFGIAKASHALRLGRTEIGQVKGTPGYMAPEHRLGLSVDHRADVYGVGAVAYELLTSQPVYLELLTPASVTADGSPQLRPLAVLRPDIPADLVAAVTRALAADPAERWRDCAHLERALAALATQHGLADDKQIGQWVAGELQRTYTVPGTDLAALAPR